MKQYDIILTVTNDLNYDQRMQRICTSLSRGGYNILLVGRTRPDSIPLKEQPFKQKRLRLFFDKGFAFYAEYNIRLFIFLFFTPTKAYYAVDLDTILPNLAASLLFNKKRLYDAHELFTEQKEVVTRPKVHRFWIWVERISVPKFRYGYTVNHFIKEELERRYGVKYEVISNMPFKKNYPANTTSELPFILYQGAVNEGRSFETLIPAMKWVNAKLLICGKGNMYEEVKRLVAYHKLEDKVEMRGYVSPDELKTITPKAYFGLTLFEATGLNQYYSLCNRFFDYIMAGIPQLCVNYPEYKLINDQHNIALMIDDVKSETISAAMNRLLSDKDLHHSLQQNTAAAKEVYNWESEEIKLLAYWKNIFI